MATAAELFADRTRAELVAALLDGRALAAGELARAAGVSAPTVSAQLRRLLEADIITVETQGRHRYYRLTDARVGQAFEALAALAPTRPVHSLRQSRASAALHRARTCYDHLAGKIAIRLTNCLLQRQVLEQHEDTYVLGDNSEDLTAFGLDLPALTKARRSFAHPCLDWSERHYHLAGTLGAALLTRMTELGWLNRHPSNRAVTITAPGHRGLREAFGCDLPDDHKP